MSKSYCAVDGCSNKSDKLGLFRFFKLPVDEERRTKWLEKIGRTNLLQRKGFRPHSHCVCSAHFEDSCLVTKLYLTPDAVPTLLLPGSTGSEETVSPSSEEFEVKLGDVALNAFLNLSGWQNRIKNLSKLERNDFALKLYLANPAMYRLLKSQFKLPNLSTLKRLFRIPFNNFDNMRDNERAMEYLALKMKSLPREAKYCSMSLAEVKLKPYLYYDIKKDCLIGSNYLYSFSPGPPL